MTDGASFQLKFLLAVFEASSEGILVVDHKTRAVTARNKRFFEVFRYPQELREVTDDNALLGWATSQVTNPEQFFKLVLELYAEPHRISSDTLTLIDGRTVDRHSEPIIIDGEILGRVWYFKDITEKLKQQAQLEHSAKMATLGEMAGGVAHEINNPLTIISGSANQVKRELGQNPLDAAAVFSKLDRIEATVERIANIVRSLRTYSRDGSKDPFSVTHLPGLIHEVLSLCEDKFKTREVDLITESIPNLQFECRPTEIMQVVLNLLNNALEATEDQHDGWVKLKCNDLIDRISIHVQDSGDGISDENREKIFQPFFTTKDVGKGTGLGLSIAKGIIESHTGSIEVTRTKPTEFIITLPKKPNQQVMDPSS